MKRSPFVLTLATGALIGLQPACGDKDMTSNPAFDSGDSADTADTSDSGTAERRASAQPQGTAEVLPPQPAAIREDPSDRSQ